MSAGSIVFIVLAITILLIGVIIYFRKKHMKSKNLDDNYYPIDNGDTPGLVVIGGGSNETGTTNGSGSRSGSGSSDK